MDGVSGVVVTSSGSGMMGRVPELSRHKTDLDVTRKPHNKQQQALPHHNGLQRKSDKKRISGW